MNILPVEGGMIDAIVEELAQSDLFTGFSKQDLGEVAKCARMVQFDPGETIMKQGDQSDSFAVIASGEVIVNIMHQAKGEMVEVARVKPFHTIGELGLLLGEPRSATVVAGQDAIVLQFDMATFTSLFKSLPHFGLLISRVLAQRLQHSSKSVLLPQQKSTEAVKADPEAAKLLPVDFMQRHRVLPLKLEGNIMHLGFVEDPTPQVIAMAHDLLPGMELRPTGINTAAFNEALRSVAGKKDEREPISLPGKKKALSDEPRKSALSLPDLSQQMTPEKQLDQILRRMVAEGASDVHLSAGHKPRWRIDGEMYEMSDTPMLGPASVMELCASIMPERNKAQFKSDNDTDFAHSIPDVARYRVNMFADNHGAGAVFRQIPDKILSISQMGLPAVITDLCDYPKGLVLVTGPTGSGKSTTLAAMIDHLNNKRKAHIITLEDPIEFVHQSKMCLINQREVGPHTTSFSRALRAALREDPDIVLVGEMRDLETVALALETANTGHLVFGTLHTNTAISSVARIIDMFPAEQQNQIRAVLADNLRGVVAQTLCRRVGGGRVAALEIMVSDVGISNLIRENKTHQMMTAMQTGKSRGNRILNEELIRMIAERVIEESEGLTKAVDKPDLMSRIEAMKRQQAEESTQKAGRR